MVKKTVSGTINHSVDLGKTASSSIIGIRNIPGTLGIKFPEEPNPGKILAVAVDSHFLQGLIVRAVHGEDYIVAGKILRDELLRPADGFDSVTGQFLPHPRIRRFPDVIRNGSGRGNPDPLIQASLPELMNQNRMGRRRPADIAHADKHDIDASITHTRYKVANQRRAVKLKLKNYTLQRSRGSPGIKEISPRASRGRDHTPPRGLYSKGVKPAL